MSKTIIVWGAIIVGTVGLLIILASFGAGGGTPVVTGTPNPQISALLPTDQTIGDKSSKIVIVEYADYECPACAAYNQYMKKLIPELGGKFFYIYRDFPLKSIHPNAELAAWAAQAAGVQGKFWEMHNALFSGQAEWATLSSADARAKFVTYATTLGLNTSQFSTDMDSQTVQNAVKAGEDSAASLRLDSTPSFFINGSYLQFKLYTYDELKQIVQQAIDNNQ